MNYVDDYPDTICVRNILIDPIKALECLYMDDIAGPTMETILSILRDYPDLQEAGYYDKPKVEDASQYGDKYHVSRIKYFLSHPDEITPIIVGLWYQVEVGYRHMIEDGWHRTHAAAILGINILCKEYNGEYSMLKKIMCHGEENRIMKWNIVNSPDDFPEEGDYLVETTGGEYYAAEMNMDGRWIFENNDITESVSKYTRIGEE